MFLDLEFQELVLDAASVTAAPAADFGFDVEDCVQAAAGLVASHLPW